MKQIQTDVGIIAAGAAGLAAAISATEMGARVAVFEKRSVTGGSANMGMGLFAVESSVQKQMGDTLTKEAAFQRYMEEADWNVDANIVHDYFWKSADTVQWLIDMGVHFAGAVKNFPKSYATWHVVLPDNGRPTGRSCAVSMLRIMTERAKELGVEFYMNTPVTSLKKEGSRVKGLIAKNEKTGEEYNVAAKAVIVCTGGFGSAPEMIASEAGYTFGKDMVTFMVPGITGDGLKMVWAAGGGKGRIMMEKIIGHTLPEIMNGKVNQFLNFIQGSPVAVNKAGQRVCDETVMQNMSVGANIIDIQQDRTLYKILDDEMIRYFRENGQEYPNEVVAGDPTDHFDEVWRECAQKHPESAFVADSMEELADRMGIDQGTLAATVTNYNRMCDEGRDDVFGKPRQFLHALRGKTFYGYRLTIMAYGSLGGIKVNPSYEVIAQDGSVIEGLYCAGNDCCEIYNGTYNYNFPGNSMGFAVNSGRIAAECAAAFAREK